ncbi:hypothetical protein Calkr_1815 [Caldicellulosiruptor acetigenus I77R1B]|uniref:Uncharacterized protein n=1 Tax=Caldicellulosiruptor acetigenus (strain ATCC 700853 / DSM 12137 / I77R1B) TaxID=632335 RepID=E4S434_CALA7|nr:hypothetical protein [Caldicellulosiruptor acetigenus]ADQ41301.1 hypothetical protein Calkr_1815 [Caldicellulosiruptor acetigenus I77R1B]
MKNINVKKLIINPITLFLVIIFRFCFVNDIAKGENIIQQTNTSVKNLYELKVDKKLQCYFEKNYAYIKLPQDFSKKSIDINLRIYRKNKTTEDYYLTLYQINNQIFRYKIDGDNISRVEAYILKDAIGASIKDVANAPEVVFVNVYSEPKSKVNPTFLVVRGYTQDNEPCYVSSMNIRALSKGENNLYIRTDTPSNLAYIEAYLEYATIKSTRVVDWAYDKIERRVYVTATYYEPYFEHISQKKGIIDRNQMFDRYLYLKLNGYDLNGKVVALSSRNMVFDIRKLISTEGYVIDTCIAQLNLPETVVPEKWEVECFTRERIKILENKTDSSYVVDWCLDKTGNLYIVAMNNTKKDMQFLVIRGYDDKNNKIFLSSRNVRLKPQTIDTSVISGVPTYLKNVQVEIVQNKSMPSFIVDWCLDKQGNLYIVGINNSERDDNLWVKIEGYDQKGQKIWLGSRNFRVRKGTIDTCVVNNIPAYVKKVNVSILPEQYGVKIQEKLFDRERKKLYIIITNFENNKNIQIQMNGFDANGKLVYKTVYNAIAKGNIVGAHTINISNGKVERVEINVLK